MAPSPFGLGVPICPEFRSAADIGQCEETSSLEQAGDKDAELVRLDIGSEPPETGLWLVTYPDLRRTPAIKAVMEFLVHYIGRETHYADKDARK